jgi:hypothetical protein
LEFPARYSIPGILLPGFRSSWRWYDGREGERQVTKFVSLRGLVNWIKFSCRSAEYHEPRGGHAPRQYSTKMYDPPLLPSPPLGQTLKTHGHKLNCPIRTRRRVTDTSSSNPMPYQPSETVKCFLKVDRSNGCIQSLTRRALLCSQASSVPSPTHCRYESTFQNG